MRRVKSQTSGQPNTNTRTIGTIRAGLRSQELKFNKEKTKARESDSKQREAQAVTSKNFGAYLDPQSAGKSPWLKGQERDSTPI